MSLPAGREEGPSDGTGLPISRRGADTENGKVSFFPLCSEPFPFCLRFLLIEGRDHSLNTVGWDPIYFCSIMNGKYEYDFKHQ